MTTDPKLRKRGKLKVALLITIAAVVGLFAFVKLNPLIFNESFLGHAHCITQAGLALRFYANEHGGHYPTHTNGFGDAILPLIGTADAHPFTGPMFDASELLAAKATGRDVDESKLGRIYVQGLTETNNPAIAIMFDQLATPGGDHCHGLARLFSTAGREILWLDGTRDFVKSADWSAFAANQIALLVSEGIDLRTARRYYEMTGLRFEK
jgi:hypothetical protein